MSPFTQSGELLATAVRRVLREQLGIVPIRTRTGTSGILLLSTAAPGRDLVESELHRTWQKLFVRGITGLVARNLSEEKAA